MKGSPPPASLRKSMMIGAVGSMMATQLSTKPVHKDELRTVRQNAPREKKRSRHKFRADKAQRAVNEEERRAKKRKHQRKARKRNRTK